MAGLYVIIGDQERLKSIRIATQRLKFFDEEHVEMASEAGLAFGWVSQDDPELFGPALDPQTGIRVISAGRVAWDEPEWQQAASLTQYKGGLSNRLLLQQYLKGGIRVIERYNGAAILLIWDPRQQQVHLLTDLNGYYPIFLYQPEQINGCVIASFPDAIADDPAVQTTLDHVSMAEFLWQRRATPPHTYYQEIKYAGAATHWLWDLSRKTCQRREYWQPFQEDYFSSLPEAVEAVAAAVRRSIYIRTLPRLGPIASFTSGGLDSRIILFSAADPSCLSGVNLYDIPNRESAIAQQVCQATGVNYVGFARDPDYYPQLLRPGAKYSGAMWSLFEDHFLGTRELVCGKLAARTVLCASSTDFLFKDANLDRSPVRLLGQKLPLFAFSQWNGGFVDPPRSRNPQPPAFAASMRQRTQEWFAGVPVQLRSDPDWLRVEEKRNRPMCCAGGLSMNLMFRTFPYDNFLADRAIAEYYSRVPARWKLNSRLWGLVTARICGHSIVDANRGWRPGASNGEKLLVFAKEQVGKRLGLVPTVGNQGLATDGSWPKYNWYIRHSPTLQEMWETTPPADRQLLSDLWGSDPWQVPLDQWAERSPRDIWGLVTLLAHWAARRETGRFLPSE